MQAGLWMQASCQPGRENSARRLPCKAERRWLNTHPPNLPPTPQPQPQPNPTPPTHTLLHSLPCLTPPARRLRPGPAQRGAARLHSLQRQGAPPRGPRLQKQAVGAAGGHAFRSAGPRSLCVPPWRRLRWPVGLASTPAALCPPLDRAVPSQATRPHSPSTSPFPIPVPLPHPHPHPPLCILSGHADPGRHRR